MKSEEMLSSQMLSGIPEVDLGKFVVNVISESVIIYIA